MLIQVSKLYAMLSTGNKVFNAHIINIGPAITSSKANATKAAIEVPIFIINLL
jgi:hypothetical protein